MDGTNDFSVPLFLTGAIMHILLFIILLLAIAVLAIGGWLHVAISKQNRQALEEYHRLHRGE